MNTETYYSQPRMRELVGGKLYLSGPMQSQPDHGLRSFTDACAELRSLGWDVVSPHELELYSQEMQGDEYYAECLRKDLIDMLRCQGICLLDDWWRSKGAMIELNAAVACGLAVVRYMPTVGVVPA